MQEGIAAIQEEPETPPAGAQAPVPNPLLEEQCASVSQADMDAAEEKVSDLSGELIVLTAEDSIALGCSRYRKSLRGELASY